MNKDRATGSIDEVIPLLVELGQGLDQDMSLGSLARDFGASPFQFHRMFSAAVGETPKRHVNRLRLERAAYKLAITEDSVLEVGLAVGFNSHETFCRAFRRRFGISPRAYRNMARAAQRERMRRNRAFRGDGCTLSEVRFEVLRQTFVLAIRHVGAYAEQSEEIRTSLWDEIVRWAADNGVACGAARLGLFPDDPTLTPGRLQQSDICVPITGPAPQDDRVRRLELEGGVYGVIDHSGPPSTAGQAYRNLADGVRASQRYVLRETPPIHLYLPPLLQDGVLLSRSRIMFPVRPRA